MRWTTHTRLWYPVAASEWDSYTLTVISGYIATKVTNPKPVKRATILKYSSDIEDENIAWPVCDH